MTSTSSVFWRGRVGASAIYVTLRLSIALCASLLVFAIWYPNPDREIFSGWGLFFSVVALAVFNHTKPWTGLRSELELVGRKSFWTVFLYPITT